MKTLNTILLILSLIGSSSIVIAQPRPITRATSQRVDSVLLFGIYPNGQAPNPVTDRLILYTHTNGDTLHMVAPNGTYGTLPTQAQTANIINDSLTNSAFGVNAPSTYGNTTVWAGPDSLTWAPQSYSKSVLNANITTSDTLFLFRTDAAITIDSVWYVNQSTSSASVVPSIEYGDGIRKSKTKLITSPVASTNVDEGETISSFDNGSIAVNKYVYLVFTTVTTAPKEFVVVIYFRYQ